MQVDREQLIACPVCEAVNINKGKKNKCRRCGSGIYTHQTFQ
ncbi:MAG: paraquat-inducible membrane protein A, partial [Sulfurovum sp. 28-43-6]